MSSILAGYLDETGLRTAVDALACPGTMFIVEGMERMALGLIDESTQTPLEDLGEEGRLFTAQFELRWQRLRGWPAYPLPFRACLIADAGEPLAAVEGVAWQSTRRAKVAARELEMLRDESAYLWGERVADAEPPRWYEKAVSRLFDYPITAKNARRVKTRIRVYRFLHTDLIVHRFVDLTAAEE